MNVNDKAQSGDNFTPARDVAPLFVEAHHARIICLPSGRKLYMACSGTDAEAEFDDIAMVLDAINRLPPLLAPFGEAALAGERVRKAVRTLRAFQEADAIRPGDLDDTLVELGLIAACRQLNWAAFAALLED